MLHYKILNVNRIRKRNRILLYETLHHCFQQWRKELLYLWWGTRCLKPIFMNQVKNQFVKNQVAKTCYADSNTEKRTSHCHVKWSMHESASFVTLQDLKDHVHILLEHTFVYKQISSIMVAEFTNGWSVMYLNEHFSEVLEIHCCLCQRQISRTHNE